MDKRKCFYPSAAGPAPDILPMSFVRNAWRFRSMDKVRFSPKVPRGRKYATHILALAWTLGLVFGFCAIAAGLLSPAFGQAVKLPPSLFSILRPQPIKSGLYSATIRRDGFSQP